MAVAPSPRSGGPASSRGLEITETTLMEHAEAARRTIGILRAQGVHFAIDDFGTAIRRSPTYTDSRSRS